METEELNGGCLVEHVLIVPCGMETSWSTTASNDFSVLIVPCGMETGVHGGR